MYNVNIIPITFADENVNAFSSYSFTCFFFRKKKLFGSWQKTTDTRPTEATLLLHNVLKAFRFPDESQIYLKCDIEVRIVWIVYYH